MLYKRKLQKDTILKTNREQDSESIAQYRSEKTAKPEEIKKIVDNLYIKKERREDADLAKREEN